MSPLSIAAIVVACLLAGALLGMALRARLPERHLSQESMDVIKLATGLMATLVALVLGLLISAANTAHNTFANDFDMTRANAELLDRSLAAYGQEDARELLRDSLVRRFQTRWPERISGQRSPQYPPIATSWSNWNSRFYSWRRGTMPRNGSRRRRCSWPTSSPRLTASW